MTGETIPPGDRDVTSRRSRDGTAPRLLWGVALILLGVALLPDPLGPIDIEVRDLVRQWPLLLVVLGVVQMMNARRGERSHGGLLIVVGAWFLLNRWTSMDGRDTWPLLIVAVGVMMIWTALTQKPARAGCGENIHVD